MRSSIAIVAITVSLMAAAFSGAQATTTTASSAIPSIGTAATASLGKEAEKAAKEAAKEAEKAAKEAAKEAEKAAKEVAKEAEKVAKEASKAEGQLVGVSSTVKESAVEPPSKAAEDTNKAEGQLVGVSSTVKESAVEPPSKAAEDTNKAESAKAEGQLVGVASNGEETAVDAPSKAADDTEQAANEEDQVADSEDADLSAEIPNAELAAKADAGGTSTDSASSGGESSAATPWPPSAAGQLAIPTDKETSSGADLVPFPQPVVTSDASTVEGNRQASLIRFLHPGPSAIASIGPLPQVAINQPLAALIHRSASTVTLLLLIGLGAIAIGAAMVRPRRRLPGKYRL